MSASFSAYIDVVNTSFSNYFNNTSNNDVVMYPDSSNQSIHFGTRLGTNPSMLKVTSSNVELNGDIALTRGVQITGLSVAKRATAGTMQNVTSTVTSIPSLSSNQGNVTLSLSTGQSNLQIGNSNNSNIAYVTDTGNMYIRGNLSAGNLGLFRNRIINGDMRISQRGTSLTTSTGTSNVYLLDRSQVTYSITTGGFTQSNTDITASDTPFQHGFRDGWRVTATTANTSYAYICPSQYIEGTHIDDLMWGTPYGQPVTVSFWFKTNVATNSIISLALRNAANNYSYTVPITVSLSGVWQFASATIPPPPNPSTWVIDHTAAGVQLLIGAYGSALLSSNPSTWEASNKVATSTSVNIWSTINNYIEITGLQFEKGAIATPFEFRPSSIELQLCQRYYQILPGGIGAYTGGSASPGWTIVRLPFPRMRATPTITNNPIIFQMSGTGSTHSLTLVPTANNFISGGAAGGGWGAIYGGCLEYPPINLQSEL